jgi:hypothetical protein
VGTTELDQPNRAIAKSAFDVDSERLVFIGYAVDEQYPGVFAAKELIDEEVAGQLADVLIADGRKYFVVVPARAAYSHSASVGSR